MQSLALERDGLPWRIGSANGVLDLVAGRAHRAPRGDLRIDGQSWLVVADHADARSAAHPAPSSPGWTAVARRPPRSRSCGIYAP